MSQYKTGTVSVTTGDQTVTGTNTLWVANVNPGDGFTVAGTGVPYTVASVTNDTSLTISAPYAGGTASGQSYAIWRDFTTNENLPELSQGDIETATIWTRALRLIDGFVGAATTTSRGTVEKATTAEAEAGTADKYPDAAATHAAIRELAVGTVSQSAGVPTGAIIERGSNANGEYTKFADGTMHELKRWSGTELDGVWDDPNNRMFGITWPISAGNVLNYACRMFANINTFTASFSNIDPVARINSEHGWQQNIRPVSTTIKQSDFTSVKNNNGFVIFEKWSYWY